MFPWVTTNTRPMQGSGAVFTSQGFQGVTLLGGMTMVSVLLFGRDGTDEHGMPVYWVVFGAPKA
jgi:hypothetical protein